MPQRLIGVSVPSAVSRPRPSASCDASSPSSNARSIAASIWALGAILASTARSSWCELP